MMPERHTGWGKRRMQALVDVDSRAALLLQ